MSIIPNTDILNHGKLKNLPNYKIFRLRHPRLVAHKTLHNWSFKLINKNSTYKVIVMGYINDNTLIQTSFIENANFNVVVTENCTVYKVERFTGELPHPLFDESLLVLFKDGFPANWKEIIERECAKIKKREGVAENECNFDDLLMKNMSREKNEDEELERAKEKIFLNYLSKLRKDDNEIKKDKKGVEKKDKRVDRNGRQVVEERESAVLGKEGHEHGVKQSKDIRKGHADCKLRNDPLKVVTASVKENEKLKNEKNMTSRTLSNENVINNEAYDTDKSCISPHNIKKSIRLSIAVKKGTATVSKLSKAVESTEIRKDEVKIETVDKCSVNGTTPETMKGTSDGVVLISQDKSKYSGEKTKRNLKNQMKEENEADKAKKKEQKRSESKLKGKTVINNCCSVETIPIKQIELIDFKVQEGNLNNSCEKEEELATRIDKKMKDMSRKVSVPMWNKYSRDLTEKRKDDSIVEDIAYNTDEIIKGNKNKENEPTVSTNSVPKKRPAARRKRNRLTMPKGFK